MTDPVNQRSRTRKAELMNSFQAELAQTWTQASEEMRAIDLSKSQIAEREEKLSSLVLKLAEDYQQTSAAISAALDKPTRQINVLLRRARERRKNESAHTVSESGSSDPMS